MPLPSWESCLPRRCIFVGVRGYVVDGGCRDTQFILELGFPVFCSFTTPKDIVGMWVPDRIGEPITIGDVTMSAATV